MIKHNLNTSHVNVNLMVALLVDFLFLYLNTSHVNVNHLEIDKTQENRIFKYISC
ncbi:hypothetical protein M945_0048 [Clostridium saccharobutylicum DSM 13864]|nr:hypothetical protein M945_0048 [Clostridium saccharobutylicum DSM 13864]